MRIEEWKSITANCAESILTLKDAEELLNKRGYLYASEIGIPMSDRFGIGWQSENGVWDPEWRISDAFEDGTVLLDFDVDLDNMTKILALESKLNREFADLESKIERS